MKEWKQKICCKLATSYGLNRKIVIFFRSLQEVKNLISKK